MNSSSIAAVAAGAVAAVAGGWTYAALSAESQWFGRTVIAGRDPGEIALTFDDGPNDEATERLLEVLARYGVRASFFVIGRFVRERPQIVRAVAAAGHLVGNHTMTHPWLTWQTDARIREELAGCNAAIEDVLGAPVRYFRAPHGARRPFVLRTARELGLVPVQWNIIPGDWKPVGAAEIVARTVRAIEGNRGRGWGSNVVLHDGGDRGLGAERMATVAAVEGLLERYRGGAKFVGVDAWG